MEVNSPQLIALIKNNKVTIMEIGKIQKFINKLNGYELSVLNFFCREKIR